LKEVRSRAVFKTPAHLSWHVSFEFGGGQPGCLSTASGFESSRCICARAHCVGGAVARGGYCEQKYRRKISSGRGGGRLCRFVVLRATDECRRNYRDSARRERRGCPRSRCRSS